PRPPNLGTPISQVSETRIARERLTVGFRMRVQCIVTLDEPKFVASRSSRKVSGGHSIHPVQEGFKPGFESLLRHLPFIKRVHWSLQLSRFLYTAVEE